MWRGKTERRGKQGWNSDSKRSSSAEPAEEARPVDPEIQKKLTDIEKKLARMNASDPWANAAWNKPNMPAGGAPSAYVGKGGGERWKAKRFGETGSHSLVRTVSTRLTSGRGQGIHRQDSGQRQGPSGGDLSVWQETCRERGAARFKTREGMWEYMTNNAGSHKHDFEGKKGQSKIYCNVDSSARDRDGGPQERKDKAMRKVVRTIIEASGGDGQRVKKQIDTSYMSAVSCMVE